jgi:hypothetical protein
MVQWNYKNEVGWLLLCLLFPLVAAGFILIYGIFQSLPLIFALAGVVVLSYVLIRQRKK